MKKHTAILIFPFLILGLFLILNTGCKKEDDDDKALIQIPAVTTEEVSGITQFSAVCGGTVTSDFGSPVKARGVCWSTGLTPTIADNKTNDGAGAGSFTSSVTGLAANTTYYVRAYATNSNGTGYGSTMSFTTYEANTFIDNRDGSAYRFVAIGSQVWMAENLRYLPYVVETGTQSVTFPYYYVYGYSGTVANDAKATANYKRYGVLYNWAAVMHGEGASSANPSEVQGICPDGWHLPSDNEWKTLEMYLGMSQAQANAFDDRGTDEGGKLKEAGVVHWKAPNTGATNSSGFTALPGGVLSTDSIFISVGEIGSWWSTTQGSGAANFMASYRALSFWNSQVNRDFAVKKIGLSVRCVRD